MKLILLDRDGVINQDSEHYIKSPEEWQALPGSLEAIAKLNNAGYKVSVVTNQSGVGRGMYSLATLDEIHQKMHDELSQVNGHLDKIFYCPHAPDDNCECRKPKPGLLTQALEHFGIAPEHTIFIGDSIRDIQAADAAHCHSALVLTGNGKKTADKNPNLKTYQDLNGFTETLLTAQEKN